MRCSWSQRLIGPRQPPPPALLFFNRSLVSQKRSADMWKCAVNLRRFRKAGMSAAMLGRRRACHDSLFYLSLYLSLALSVSLSEECLPLCQHDKGGFHPPRLTYFLGFRNEKISKCVSRDSSKAASENLIV